MRTSSVSTLVLVLITTLVAAPARAQQANAPKPPSNPAPAAAPSESQRPPVLSAQARLTAARKIVIQHAGGTIPNDVIGEAFEGWGRYTVVFEREQADMIVSIEAPTVEGGVSLSSGNGKTSNSRTLNSGAVTQIRLVIRDAHNGLVLWSGVEIPHSAINSKRRQENEIEASLKVFRRFRAMIEPEPVQ